MSRLRTRAPLAAALAAVSVLGVVPGAAAETKTFGANLSRPANGTLDCTVLPGFFQLPSGADSCSWWSMETFADANEGHLAPYPGGVVRRVRIKVGAVTGPMRIDVIRLRREAAFTGSAACCFATGVSSHVFTPAQNAITTVPVNLPVRHKLQELNNTWDFDTLALSVLEPGVPIPLHDTGQQSYYGPASASLYPHFDQNEEIRRDPHGLPGYQVLMNADIELGTSIGSSVPHPPPPPPPPPPPVELLSKSARAKRGIVNVVLKCGFAQRCVGKLRLQNRNMKATASATQTRRRSPTRTYAIANVRIPAARKGTVRARLTKHGRQLLRRKSGATVYANVVLAGKRMPGMRLKLRR